MPVRFEFEVFGDKLVVRDLLRFGHAGLDASAAFEDIADAFMRTEKRRFETVGNGTWPDIHPLTKAKKVKSANPTIRANAFRVLIATGALRRSLTVRGDPSQVLHITPHTLVFGSSLERARWHQQGTRRTPIRKPLGFTENAKRNAIRILQRHIVEAGR